MTEEALFHAARDLPPEERPAWPAEHCPHAGLRGRVEGLLAAAAAAGGFLHQPPAGATGAYTLESAAVASPGPTAEGAGARVGPYKLLQLIGEGGMGAVW